MRTSVAMSLVAAAICGAALISEPDTSAVAATPFWQMHGAAPSFVETEVVRDLRQAARGIEKATVVALNVQ